MQDNKLRLTKIISLVLAAGLIAFTGKMFYDHRHFTETVVGTHVTESKMLSEYYPPIEGTFGDTRIYVIDSGVPGGNVLLLGGSHPEEPAGILAAYLFAENAKVETGKLFIALHASNSGSRSTRPGEGYPLYFYLDTPWGEKQFRMGDRFYNPLDSWPDPEVYVHSPSGQMLSNTDIRNHNRAWPGRANGMLAQQSAYAFMQMVEQENINFVIDLHEAELEYPVINAIVYHEKGGEVATWAGMRLNTEEFETGGPFSVAIKTEKSPPALHGLTHREIGDASVAFAFLAETAEPMLDRIRAQTGTHLLLTGKDPLVQRASTVGTGPFGLLYSPIDELGWPIAVRVGRHVSTVLTLIEEWSAQNPNAVLTISGMPRYSEIMNSEYGVGSYLHDPSKAAPSQIFAE